MKKDESIFEEEIPCEKKSTCVPKGMGCSSFYCKECKERGYVYYFDKDWREKIKPPKATCFADQGHHAPIRSGSGVTFGW